MNAALSRGYDGAIPVGVITAWLMRVQVRLYHSDVQKLVAVTSREKQIYVVIWLLVLIIAVRFLWWRLGGLSDTYAAWAAEYYGLLVAPFWAMMIGVWMMWHKPISGQFGRWWWVPVGAMALALQLVEFV